MDIETIKDFDFGAGDSDSFFRVSSVSTDNVTSPEVRLVLWLLLEQKFGHKRSNPRQSVDSEECTRSSEKECSLSDSDSDKSERSGSLSEAEEYARALLKQKGVDVPFELLSDVEKSRLFDQFSAANELLATNQYSSVLELFENLRSHSKFKEDFQVTSELGEGKFGKVYAVRKINSSPEELFAVKKITLRLTKMRKIKAILSEASILKKLSGHDRVVRFHNSWLAMECVDTVKYNSLVFYLQMELCGLSLKQWKLSHRTAPITNEQCILIGKQITEGVAWIHSKNILHLDINPSNIFWSDGTCQDLKIGDFGLGEEGSSFNDRRGTVPYCAPEKVMTSKSDVFSVGVTIFDLTQEFSTKAELAELISALTHRSFTTGMAKLDDIITLMTAKEPHKRPSASQLLESTFL